MRFVLPFPPSRGIPLGRHHRHPLVRALSLLIGLAVIGVLLICGLVVAGVMLVGGAILLAVRQWNRRAAAPTAAPRPGQQPQTLEGEFVVLQQGRPVPH